MRLGQWTNDHYCVVVSNRNTHAQSITTHNLRYALLLKGLNFNTHGKYFETSNLTYKGRLEDINDELFSDAVMFSLFYKGFSFSNKEKTHNYIMPFTAEELQCPPNELNVLFPEDYYANETFAQLDFDNDGRMGEVPFDFREWMSQFRFSAEAQELHAAALDVFLFYHHCNNYTDKNWNDSFYDIANAIMGKDPEDFQEMDAGSDRRVTRVKTTKGTRGFGRNGIHHMVPAKDIPVFTHFFDARDALATKINRQLVNQHLLLWERENIY